ncbi:MAG: spore cortex biosynthesis protein YabQ [Lachnospiraceae bacterium]|nr:spore cortex biosynthesis protein YabQ [Lachnospiraceae bacterium]
MAFLYDIFRLFRRLIRHGRLAVDLEDILYWAVCFGISFALLYYGNNGVIRFAAVFGAAVGMLAYIATLGRFFVRFSYAVIDKTIGSLLRMVKKMLRRLKILFRPVKKTIVNLHDKINLFYQNCRLTGKTFRHNIIMCRQKKTQNRKGEANHGKAKKQKGKTKKNAGVSPRQK